jgi:hypothetical protein
MSRPTSTTILLEETLRKRRRPHIDNSSENLAKRVQKPSQYTYKPLCASDAVRVLVLKPNSDFNADLEGEIIQYRRSEMFSNTDSDAHYDAISYTWGHPTFSCQLFCDRHSSVLNITLNVDSMLRHLRTTSSRCYLWIDAVCLNQSDATEKKEQIPLMGEIYREAKEVRIWLGKAVWDISRVFTFLKYLAILAKTHKPTAAVREAALKLFTGGSYSPIRQFLHNPWFLRRWVLQEAALGRVTTVHCGQSKILWQVLLNTL